MIRQTNVPGSFGEPDMARSRPEMCEVPSGLHRSATVVPLTCGDAGQIRPTGLRTVVFDREQRPAELLENAEEGVVTSN